MKVLDDLLYTDEHEWVKIDGNLATIGITDFAQGELGDIIFIEFPTINSEVNAGDSVGTIEAVKTVADICTPVTGTVDQINLKLENNPELTNSDPYGKGWMIKLVNVSNGDIKLLTALEYEALIS